MIFPNSSSFSINQYIKDSSRDIVSTESRPISWFIESWGRDKLFSPSYREDFSSWTKKQKQELILSLFQGQHVGYFTSSIRPEGSYLLLDGRQRLQAVLEFTQNKFPVIIEGTKVWFHPKGDFHLAQEERSYFLNSILLSSIVYFNLSVEGEISKYNRIQHCVKK